MDPRSALLLGLPASFLLNVPALAQSVSGRLAGPRPAGTLSSTEASSGWMQVVAGAGDVNGDGRSDVMVGFVPAGERTQDPGEARLYLGAGGGFSPLAAWRMLGQQAGQNLGAALGTAGDVNGDGFDDVLVGAPGEPGTLPGEGRAYLFLGSSTGLATTPAWSAGGAEAWASFGSALARAGDVNGDGFDDVVVGAPRFDGGQVDSGAAFLFLGSASGLASTPDTSLGGGQAGARQGTALAGAADVDGDGYDDLVVGSPGWDATSVDAGRATLYLGHPNGLLASAAWTYDGSGTGERFGQAVAMGDLNGDGYGDVVVGAVGSLAQGGSVVVFFGSATGLATTPSWTATGTVGTGFGSAVAVVDLNTDGIAELVVGVPGDDPDPFDAGRVLVFRGSPGGPIERAVAVAGDKAGLRLGTALAALEDADGDGRGDLALGHELAAPPALDEPVRTVSGADLLLVEADWFVLGTIERQRLGTRVGGAGDVDGDGYHDVLVTTGEYLHPEDRSLRLYPGSADGPAAAPSWQLSGLLEVIFGTVEATSAGDVNGDGYDDILVGADFYGPGLAGAAAVFDGGSSGPATFPDWMVFGTQPFEAFGSSVSSAGDVDADGYDDVLVLDLGDAQGSTLVPRAHLYGGSSTGLSTTELWTYVGAELTTIAVDVFGAGDVDGDGFDDVLVPGGPGTQHLFLGSSTGPGSVPDWSSPYRSATPAGDVDGDGYDDLLTFSPSYSGPESSEGIVQLFLGGPTGPSTTADWTMEGNAAGAGLGTFAIGVGDTDGDGFDDVVVTATPGRRAYLLKGSSSGLSSPARIVTEPDGTTWFGRQASAVGDVDGDGRDDWMLGDFGWTFDRNEQGAAFLFRGQP